MNRHLQNALLALIVSVVWGIFSDLMHGQPGWFIIRVSLVTLATYLGSQWFERKA